MICFRQMIRPILGDRDPARLLFVDDDESNTSDVAAGVCVHACERAGGRSYAGGCECAAFPRATVLRVCGSDGMDRNDIEFVHEWAALCTKPAEAIAHSPAYGSVPPPPAVFNTDTAALPFLGGYAAPPDMLQPPIYAAVPGVYGPYAQPPLADPAAYSYYGVPAFPPC